MSTNRACAITTILKKGQTAYLQLLLTLPLALPAAVLSAAGLPGCAAAQQQRTAAAAGRLQCNTTIPENV
jgi:hypothetical protein